MTSPRADFLKYLCLNISFLLYVIVWWFINEFCNLFLFIFHYS
ncbi:hypothetical protein I656_02635 [Geobacillus sp. WSUCF1]|nr:hypothetical protein I656_02635 [Geobacillus sp. WSUCF1]